MRPPYVIDLSSDKVYIETQESTAGAKPGLAYTGPQLEILAKQGRLNVPERQPLYEPYTIDNPNPLRKPNADISDARNYSESLAEDFRRATSQLESLKAQKASQELAVNRPTTPAVDSETASSGSPL